MFLAFTLRELIRAGRAPACLVAPLLLTLLVASGCRMTRVQSDLTPLTDNLAERLKSQVNAVLRRTDDATGVDSPDDAPIMVAGEGVDGDPAADSRDRGSSAANDQPRLIEGAGFSQEGPPVGLDTGPAPGSESEGPGGLTLPMVGNVPDMARRLIPPLNLWNGGKAEPATAPVPGDALDRLIDTARAHVESAGPGTTPQQRQRYTRDQVALKLLEMIGEQPQEAISPIAGIDQSDQEFLQKLLWAHVNYFDTTTMPEPRQRATATIEQLDSAIRALQPRARLALSHLALCRRIQGFGDFEPFEKNEFSPGQAVLLYAEIKNFTSLPHGDGRQKTLLKSLITIRADSDDGDIVQQIPVGPTTDLCRTTRRDYYHNYEFQIPRSLPLGNYLLRLTVTDMLGNKVASESLRFVLQ